MLERVSAELVLIDLPSSLLGLGWGTAESLNCSLRKESHSICLTTVYGLSSCWQSHAEGMLASHWQSHAEGVLASHWWPHHEDTLAPELVQKSDVSQSRLSHHCQRGVTMEGSSFKFHDLTSTPAKERQRGPFLCQLLAVGPHLFNLFSGCGSIEQMCPF